MDGRAPDLEVTNQAERPRNLSGARAQTDQGRPPEYEPLAESLGAAKGSLTRIAGVIDDTPVVRTRAITKHLVILDAARLRWLAPRAGTDEEPAEPGLVLLPPGIAPQPARARPAKPSR
jgi:hypothetical protein